MGHPFILPEDALTPQATADPGIAAPRAAPTNTGDVLDDLFGPPVPVPGAEFLTGTGLETLEAPAIDYGQYGELSFAPHFTLQPACHCCPQPPSPPLLPPHTHLKARDVF